MNKRRSNLIMNSAAVLLFHGAANAQSAPEANPTSDTSGQQAQTMSDSDAGAIIVTARRRAELLQDVPLSVTAFSQGDLDRRGIDTLNDFARVAPSVAIVAAQGDPLQTSITIRGQGGVKGGSGPAVVSYNNEVPIADNSGSRSALGPNFFFDLENVQVLKGPQGTLFGRNSTGGALLLVTRRPSDDFEGYLKVGVGSFKQRTAEGAVNVPLAGDKILLRLAGSYQEEDGYTKSLGQPGHDGAFRLNDTNFVAGRLTLLLRPSDRVENQLTVQASKLWTNGYARILTYVDPNGFAAAVFGGPGGFLDQLDRQNQLGPFTQVETTDPGEYNRYYLSVSNAFKWNISDSVTFRSISSFQSLKTPGQSPDSDYDGTQLPVLGACCITNSNLVHQYTQELQLQGQSFNDRLTWTVGAFHLDSPFQRMFYWGLRVLGGLLPAIESYKEKSSAVFAQGTFEILDGLNVTGGIRKTWDTRAQMGNNLAANQPVVLSKAKFQKVTWTAGVNYSVSPSVMVYLNSRKGYRAGGVNPYVPSPDLLQFGPELVTDFELGMKGSWSLGILKGVTNAAIYKQNYDDVQQAVSVFVDGASYGYQVNAGKAKVKGAELEQNLQIGDAVTLNGSVAYLDYRTTKIAPNVDPLSLGAVPAPKWTYTLGGEAKLIDRQEVGVFKVRADWSWTSRRNDIFILGSPANPIKTQGPVGLLNLGASLERIAGTDLDAAILVKNVTNKAYSLGSFANPNLRFTSNPYAEPRRVLVNLSYRF